MKVFHLRVPVNFLSEFVPDGLGVGKKVVLIGMGDITGKVLYFSDIVMDEQLEHCVDIDLGVSDIWTPYMTMSWMYLAPKPKFLGKGD